MKKLIMGALALCICAMMTMACGTESVVTTIATKAAQTAIEPMVNEALNGIDPAQAQELITTRHQELIELAINKFINDPGVSELPLAERAKGAILAAANELLTPADQG